MKTKKQALSIYREAKYTVNQLETYRKKFFKAANSILVKKSTKFKVGYWCEYCPCMAVCKEHAKAIEDEAALKLMTIDDVVFPTPESLPLEHAIRITKYREQIKQHVDACEALVINRLKTGKTIEGLKLVLGPVKRKWISDIEAIASYLETLNCKKVWNQKLVGITEIEKQIGKNKLNGYTENTEAKEILVTDDDPRPAIESAADKLDSAIEG